MDGKNQAKRRGETRLRRLNNLTREGRNDQVPSRPEILITITEEALQPRVWRGYVVGNSEPGDGAWNVQFATFAEFFFAAFSLK
jgi:hypothetical protein